MKFYHVDLLVKASLAGRLSAAKSFWLVLVLYSYCLVFVVTFFLIAIKAKPGHIIEAIVMPYSIIAMLGCFHCSKNISWLAVRWLVRLFYVLLSMGVLKSAYDLMVTFFG